MGNGRELERYSRDGRLHGRQRVEGEVLGPQIRFGRKEIDWLSRYPVVRRVELHAPNGDEQIGVILPLPRGFRSVLVVMESGDGFVLNKKGEKDDVDGEFHRPRPIGDETWLSLHTVDMRNYTFMPDHASPLSREVSDFTYEGIARGLLGERYEPSLYIGSSNRQPLEGMYPYDDLVSEAGDELTQLLAMVQTGTSSVALDPSGVSPMYADRETDTLYTGLNIRMLPEESENKF